MEKVENGNIVRVNYTGKFEIGEVFDTSYEPSAKAAGNYIKERTYQPLEIKVGSGQVIEGFDKGLTSMKKGEKKELKIPPEKAYSFRGESMMQVYPLDVFSMHNLTLIKGMKLNTYSGLAEILDVNDKEVTLPSFQS
jgi:FKBP-type peptidyl-prolyl cis-trans isomerase 2